MGDLDFGSSETSNISITNVIQTALAVAVVNIQIPLLLGEVVNVVSTAEAADSFLDSIRQPVLKLIYMYILQVRPN